MGKIIWNQKLLKSILIPTLEISSIGSIDAVSTSCSCGNTVHVTSVTLNKTSIDLTEGQSETLTETVLPETATDKSVTWTSSDLSVATVDNNGTITAKRLGNATITVMSVDNPNAKATCAVNVNNSPYVVIIANTDSTLTLQNDGGNNPNLQYSTDRTNWTTYSTEISIDQGYNLYLKGNNPNGWSSSTDKYSTLSITGDVSISGNVMGLLDNGTKSMEQGDINEIPCDRCFHNLFRESVGITSVSEDFLPAATLAECCYYNMFHSCTSLTTAPELPATTLADECYKNMFYRCTSLTTAPNLPATTLTNGCYFAMFSDCTSLTTAPNLPATTLTNGCYFAMFLDCSSLTTAPELPATDLNAGCYWFIFSGCSSLNSIKIGYTGSYNSDFMDWVKGVADSGTFYYAGSQTPQDFQLPSGWTKSPF